MIVGLIVVGVFAIAFGSVQCVLTVNANDHARNALEKARNHLGKEYSRYHIAHIEDTLAAYSPHMSSGLKERLRTRRNEIIADLEIE
jgi:hypothetical protein